MGNPSSNATKRHILSFSSIKRREIRRLIEAFEVEAAKFHELRFSTFFITQQESQDQRRFHVANHGVMLWQYYGSVADVNQVQEFEKNLKSSDLKFGLRGAVLSCFGLLEGESLCLFLRMAKRAGSLFEGDAAMQIKTRVTGEIAQTYVGCK